jgi:hypothetical protein
MRLLPIFAVLILLVAACAPVAHPLLPPEEPLVFAADYDALFDATMQEITTSSVRGPDRQRLRFAIAEAERDTGLITAVHGAVHDGVFTAQRRFVTPDSRFALGLRLDVPFGRPRPGVVITVIVRPEAEGRASLVYSSVAATGAESATGNRFMARVLERLAARFGPPL